MSYRAAKFASVILASFLASAALPTISSSAAPAADDCLSGPKDQTPQGGHWFYRIERGTKRHCWYLKDASDKVSQAAPASSAPVANPAPPSRETTAQRSLSDAHAELPLPQTRFDPPPAATPAQPVAPPPATAASPDSNQPATAQDANQQTSLIASRWPDPSNVNASPSDVTASADPQPAADNSDANAETEADVAAAPPAAATAPLTAADVSSVKQPVSMQTLLLVVVGALALAGLIGMIVRFGSRRSSRKQLRGSQRINWDLVATDRPTPWNYPGPQQARTPRPGIPRELRAADDAYARMANDRIANDVADNSGADDKVTDDRITEMLARLARSSMN